jgi:sugar phosphate isomerase/epimerase
LGDLSLELRLGRAVALGALTALPATAAPDVKGQTMPATAPAERWRIGCYTRPWADFEYTVGLDAIAEAGFTWCGLMTAKSGLVMSKATTPEQAHQIGEELRKRKLKVASVYAGGLDMASRQSAVKSLRRLIDNCSVVGSLNLLLGGVEDQKLHEVYYGAVAECCAYAAEKKLEMSLKPHGGLNATGPQLRKIIEAVGHRSFRVWYDAGNVFYYSDGKLDPLQDAATVDGLVTGWCIKDFLPPKNVDVTPGAGRVDFARVFARLKQGGLKGGSLVVETLSEGPPPKRLEEARKARRFVEALISS